MTIPLIFLGPLAIYFFVAAFVPRIRMRWRYRRGTSRDRHGRKTRFVERGPHIGAISSLALGTIIGMIVLSMALGDKWPASLNWGNIMLWAVLLVPVGAIIDLASEPTTTKVTRIKEKWKKPVRQPSGENNNLP